MSVTRMDGRGGGGASSDNDMSKQRLKMGEFCCFWLSMAAFNLASKMAAKLKFQVLYRVNWPHLPSRYRPLNYNTIGTLTQYKAKQAFLNFESKNLTPKIGYQIETIKIYIKYKDFRQKTNT